MASPNSKAFSFLFVDIFSQKHSESFNEIVKNRATFVRASEANFSQKSNRSENSMKRKIPEA